MISCSLLDTKSILNKEGIEVKKDKTLLNMSRKELLQEIRILEDNLAGKIWSADLQSERLKALSKYFTTERFNKICNEELQFNDEDYKENRYERNYRLYRR